MVRGLTGDERGLDRPEGRGGDGGEACKPSSEFGPLDEEQNVRTSSFRVAPVERTASGSDWHLIDFPSPRLYREGAEQSKPRGGRACKLLVLCFWPRAQEQVMR